jgi:hypothetical protein
MNILIFSFLCLLHVSIPTVYLQEDGWIYIIYIVFYLQQYEKSSR